MAALASSGCVGGWLLPEVSELNIVAPTTTAAIRADTPTNATTRSEERDIRKAYAADLAMSKEVERRGVFTQLPRRTANRHQALTVARAHK